MDQPVKFDIDSDFFIFDSFLKSRSEVLPSHLKHDLKRYYLPFVNKLIQLKKSKDPNQGVVVGVSAIQGAGKTTQGEILEILLDYLGHITVSLSIDDHYITHSQLDILRSKDPRFIRRGLTHDIPLALSQLNLLKFMKNGESVSIVGYDKGAFGGDGDRLPADKWRKIDQKPDFIFYDGWMLGARMVEDESIFDAGLPSLDTPEHIQFAKDCNKKLLEYTSLWNLFDFMNVLYVPNYQISVSWRDQAEESLRLKGEGMTHDQITEFVHYFWRSVHPAIHIKNLAADSSHTQQVVLINDDHTINQVLAPFELDISVDNK